MGQSGVPHLGGLDHLISLAVGAMSTEPDADMIGIQGTEDFGKGLGVRGRTVVTHHLTALDALAAEPDHGQDQEADRCGLLLISEKLHIGEPLGVVDGHMNSVRNRRLSNTLAEGWR